MKISFAKPSLPTSGAVAVMVGPKGALSSSAKALDEQLDGTLTRALESGRFKGKKGEVLEILAPSGVKLTRVLALGNGEASELTPRDFEEIGGAAVARAEGGGESQLTVMADRLEGQIVPELEAALQLALGARLRSYGFRKYKTSDKPESKPTLEGVTVASAAQADAKKQYKAVGAPIAEGVEFTRDLVSEPPNVLYPESFAKQLEKLAKLGVKVSVLEPKELKKLGMGALLGVAQGSVREARVVILEWRGAGGKGEDTKPVAIVGKGVTFDTGGISIKPAAGMEDMKWDMGGAGVVSGLMKALAGRKAKANVVGIVGLVENMPSGTAQRPGDIVTSLSGKTVEIINTDAEGRLVLCDVLTHVQREYDPQAVVDLATLTGAVIVALGHDHAGLFANDDALAERLLGAGKAVGEPIWRLPLGAEYDKMIDSDVADMRNTGMQRAASSITAAQFLQRFIDEGRPWAHLDIAGVTWATKDCPTWAKGATGFGVRLLDRFIAETYES